MELEKRIEKIKSLPSPPMALQRLAAACTNDDVEAKELSELVELCPSVAAKLLGLANSAYFGQFKSTQSVQEAIVRLGLGTVRGVCVALALNSSLSTKNARKFDSLRYWFSSIVTALLSQRLYNRIPTHVKEHMGNVYINGLLHNLGVALIGHAFPEEFDQAVAIVEKSEDGVNLSSAFKEVLGGDHHQLGALLADKWKLPEEVAHVIEHHDEPDYRQEHSYSVLLAGFCAYAADLIYNKEPIETNLVSLDLLAISENDLVDVINKLNEDQEELRSMALGMAE